MLSRFRISKAFILILPSSYIKTLRPIAGCDPQVLTSKSPHRSRNTLPNFHISWLLLSAFVASVSGMRLSNCIGRVASSSIGTVPARKQILFSPYLVFYAVPIQKRFTVKNCEKLAYHSFERLSSIYHE